MTSTYRLITLATATTFFATLLLMLTGCNIVAPAVIAFSPPPTNDAAHKLADRPTVTFVDDRRNVLRDRGIRRLIGDRVMEQLLGKEVLSHEQGHAISTGDAMAVAGREADGELMSLSQIGSAVGAEQVIAIEMISFDLQSVDGSPRATAQFTVKVLDLVNRTKIFPADDGPDAQTLMVMLPVEQTFQPGLTREASREAELTLANLIADKVAKLFYKHEIRPLGANSASDATGRVR